MKNKKEIWHFEPFEPSDLNWPNEFEKFNFKKKSAASKPGLRIVEHIKWEGKDYPLPFYGMDLDTDRNKMITIQNRFGGHSISIPWFAAAVYDVIMGSEKLNYWDDHAKGLDWFGEHFPDAYMVLLD